MMFDENAFPTSPEEWCQYWQAKEFPWRTEPEIDTKRQEELSKCRATTPDIRKGIYPFKGMKLSRADVEWLLATHEDGRGPVNWDHELLEYEKRHPGLYPIRLGLYNKGLDLRGADLSQADLHSLPLTGLRGSLTANESVNESLRGSLIANDEPLKAWEITEEPLTLAAVLLVKANLQGARLEGADLGAANLKRADLSRANLSGARLFNANLTEANLSGAKLEGVDLRDVILAAEEAVLLDASTPVKRCAGPQLADVQWGSTNLAVVNWSQMTLLGDEYKARQEKPHSPDYSLLGVYPTAVRANRQLAVALQAQGLNEEAAYFAYRAQILQRKILWKERAFGKWLFSMLLALLAGYGYRMGRILIAYLFVVLLCAVAYFVLGMYYWPHLTLLEAVLTSITAFHGRVFSEPFLRPGEPQLWVTAFEAVTGLVIEGVFIAMLTQKFFGK